LPCAAQSGQSADPDARKACELQYTAQSFEARDDDGTNIGKQQLLRGF